MRYPFIAFVSIHALWYQAVIVVADDRCPDGGPAILIDFDTLPSMVETTPGMVVSDEWLPVGVSMEGRRRIQGNSFDTDQALRLFDSANPTGGDFDLGSPNEDCSGCGSEGLSCPGVAEEAWKESASTTNCNEQKRILIVDSGLEEPKDHRVGGDIIFRFTVPVTRILSFGVMDIQPSGDPTVPGPSASTYSVFDAITGMRREKEKLMGLGDNSLQEIQPTYGSESADSMIERLKLDLRGTAGVTKLEYCVSPNALPLAAVTPTMETMETTSIETTMAEAGTTCDDQLDLVKICLAMDEPFKDDTQFAMSLLSQIDSRSLGEGKYGSIFFDSTGVETNSRTRTPNMRSALSLCERFLADKDDAKKVMVVLTSGDPFSPALRRSTLVRARIAKQRHGILVVPVAIGDAVDLDFMKELASNDPNNDSEALFVEADFDTIDREMDQLLSIIACNRKSVSVE